MKMGLIAFWLASELFCNHFMQEDIKTTLTAIIEDFCKPLNIEYKTQINKEGSQYRINVISSSGELFEANNYEFLYILQYIARVGVHRKHPKDYTHFLFDVNSKRYFREKVVKEVIPDLSISEVLEKGNTVILINLNGYERKLIHNHFFNMKGITTKSLGEDDTRKIMIMPTSEIGVTGIENARVYDIEKMVAEYKARLDREAL
jgi:predicted RNA-binding protein Jag